MRVPDHAVSVELEVPFHDVDALRIVWHGHYLKYAEVARSAFLRSRRLDMEDVLALGLGMVVVDSHTRYSFPLRYGERLRASVWCSQVDHRIQLPFVIDNLTVDRCAARGAVSVVLTDAGGHLLMEVPDEVRRRLLS